MKAQIICPNFFNSNNLYSSDFLNQNKIIELFLYKIFTEEENKLFLAKGFTKGSMVDDRDGFIHLSAKGQLFETINKHFNHLETIYIYSFFMEDFGYQFEMGNITKWRIFSTLLWPFIIKGHYLFSKN